MFLEADALQDGNADKLFLPGGGLSYKNEEGRGRECSSYLKGSKICRRVPLGVLKSKTTTVRIIAVLFLGY